jgi:hypothetical protein
MTAMRSGRSREPRPRPSEGLAEADARIEATFDDIGEGLFDKHLHHDVG